MGTGEIRDFTKGGHHREGVTEIKSAKPVGNEVEILDDHSRQEGVTPVVTQHEEIVLEGQSSVRRRKPVEGEPEIKLRVGVNPEEWERVKRLEDA